MFVCLFISCSFAYGVQPRLRSLRSASLMSSRCESEPCQLHRMGPASLTLSPGVHAGPERHLPALPTGVCRIQTAVGPGEMSTHRTGLLPFCRSYIFVKRGREKSTR